MENHHAINGKIHYFYGHFLCRKLLNYQRVYPINIPLNHYKIPLNHYNIQRVTHPHLFCFPQLTTPPELLSWLLRWPSVSRLGPPEWPRRRSERIAMWLKQCHTPPIWERFIAPIYDGLGDVFFFAHIVVYCNPITGYSDLDIICIHVYLYSKFFRTTWYHPA